jgi:signal transduction histidine kinase
MLAFSSVFAAVLTIEALYAARDHRRTTERVLRDYAALGAESAAQRLKAALNGRFSTILVSAATLRQRDKSVPTVAKLRANIGANARDALDDSSRIIEVVPGDTLASLLARETESLPSFAYFGVRWIHGAGDDELLVFQPVRAQLTTPVMAFTIPRRAMSALIARLVARDPVLPSSLTHGANVDAVVGLRVTTVQGALTDRHFDATSTLRASYPLEQPYGDLDVDVSLTESLAPMLIIGGVPRSRVPILVSLLVLTIGLTVAAGDQLRRELELSRLRDDFVSSVSHELRTPLAQIRMFAETLRLGRVRSSDEAERSLMIVENEARRLEHLVENVLAISRAERRGLEVHPREVNLTSLLQEVVAEFAPLAARAESKIALSLEPAVRARVDDSAVRQIVLNLLDNAVKYGRHGQTIALRLSTSGDVISIQVDDEGKGIPVSERSQIWERFWRGSDARRSNIAGTGVGLSIVRDLVGLHGGRVRIGDAAPQGTRMVIELPARSTNGGAPT